jgi:hypothetical protein
MESMKTDSQKYSKLIHYNMYSSARNIDQLSTGYYYINRQKLYPSYDYSYEEYKSKLPEDTEKLHNKLVKEWTEQIMVEYSIKNSSSQLSKPNKEGQQQFCHKP